MSTTTLQGTSVIAGEAKAKVLVGHEPLSFWGGYDQNTGEIIDRRHPLSGQIAAQRILAIPFTRGSSTTAAVLLESIRNGTAPSAVLTNTIDHFFALASIVADEMYQMPLPLVTLEPEDFNKLESEQWVEVLGDGRVILTL